VPVTVKLSFYSGLPNPEWELSSDDTKTLSKLLADALRATQGGGAATYRGGVGYSGFVVDVGGVAMPLSTFMVCDGAVEVVEDRTVLMDPQRSIERWLFSTMPVFSPLIIGELRRALNAAGLYRPNVICKETIPNNLVSTFEPTWDPKPWNTGRFQTNNSCYNYANNLRSDTSRSGPVAEPGFGFAGGKPCKTDPCSCGAYTAAAESDGLLAARTFVGEKHVAGEWFVALFVGRGPYVGDSHWYRQDGNGLWSHKPGAQRARNCDEAGRLISNPKDADRWHLGDKSPAYEFCQFFKTGPQVKIAGR